MGHLREKLCSFDVYLKSRLYWQKVLMSEHWRAVSSWCWWQHCMSIETDSFWVCGINWYMIPEQKQHSVWRMLIMTGLGNSVLVFIPSSTEVEELSYHSFTAKLSVLPQGAYSGMTILWSFLSFLKSRWHYPQITVFAPIVLPSLLRSNKIFLGQSGGRNQTEAHNN